MVMYCISASPRCTFSAMHDVQSFLLVKQKQKKKNTHTKKKKMIDTGERHHTFWFRLWWDGGRHAHLSTQMCWKCSLCGRWFSISPAARDPPRFDSYRQRNSSSLHKTPWASALSSSPQNSQTALALGADWAKSTQQPHCSWWAVFSSLFLYSVLCWTVTVHNHGLCFSQQ